MKGTNLHHVGSLHVSSPCTFRVLHEITNFARVLEKNLQRICLMLLVVRYAVVRNLFGKVFCEQVAINFQMQFHFVTVKL